jgi:outer membrane usher protein
VRNIPQMTYKALFCGLLLAFVQASFAQPGTASFRTANPIRDTLASVKINGLLIDENVSLIEVDGLGLLMTRTDFEKLRLVKVRPWMVVRGETEDLIALSRLQGVKVELNQRTLSVELTATPELFAATNMNILENPRVVPSTVPLGAYLNYDLVSDSIGGTNSTRGLVEAVAFSQWGSVVSNHFYNLASNLPAGSVQNPWTNVRLDSYFQKDFVDSTARLKIGDAVVNPGSWGRAVRIAGLQIGTDFSLNPRFISSPLLDFRGQASLPSTVDVYVNNGLLRRYEVAPGPFSIAQIPVITGNGEARLVVRDALGRDVTISQPFFSVSSQLRPGLSQYSFEVGALRQNYGIESNQYGTPIMAATYRYGVSSNLTLEARGETFLRSEANFGRMAAAGVSAIWPFAPGHALVPTIAYSDSAAGHGVQASLQYGYSGARLFYGLRAETATANFRQVGFAAGELPQVHRYTASAGFRIGQGSVALALTDATPRPFTIQTGPAAGLVIGGNRNQIGTLSYSTSFGGGWSVAAGVSRIISGDASTQAFLSLNYIPTIQSFASAGINASRASNGVSSETAFVRAGVRALDTGGVGYDGEVSNTRQRIGVQAITRIGEFSADIANQSQLASGQNPTSGRVSVRGSVVVTGEAVAAGRPITNGFVLVTAPALANSAVRTRSGAGVQLDGSGVAVLTRITPYDQTEVQVLPENTALDITIDRFSTKVTPSAKAGTIARLEVRKTRAITFRLVDSLGKALPSGTPFAVWNTATPNEKEMGKVGLEGLVYVKDLPVNAKIVSRLGSMSCDLTLPAIPTELIPDLGDILCIPR